MVEKEIAKAIVRAQMASDKGKGIPELYRKGSTRLSRGAKKLGYDIKVDYIVTAIKLIRGNRQSVFHYYVEDCNDQNGYPSVLVYFDCRIPDGGRVQVSFHSPKNRADDLESYIGSGRPTHWRKSMCSREACKRLMAYYDL